MTSAAAPSFPISVTRSVRVLREAGTPDRGHRRRESALDVGDGDADRLGAKIETQDAVASAKQTDQSFDRDQVGGHWR